MSKQTMIAFNGEGCRLGRNVGLWWHKMLIRLPGVRHDLVHERPFDRVPYLVAGHDASGASDSMDEAFPQSINSKPDPTIVFL